MGPIPIVLGGLLLLGLGYAVTHRGSTKLPPDLQASFDDLLAHGTDPDKIEGVASQLDGLGFHEEASKLRAKEAILRGGAPAPSPATPPGGIPGGGTDPNRPRLDALPPLLQPPPPSIQPAGPSLPAQFMRVSTHDPAPSGDLALRRDPSDGSPVIGAAEKDSVVTVKGVSPDGRFVQVEAPNPAGRRASVTGWGHAAFLVPTNPMASSGRFDPATHMPYAGVPYSVYNPRRTQVGAEALVCCGAAPANGASLCVRGCDVRTLPGYAFGVVGHLSQGAVCEVHEHVGERSGAGWTRVSCEGLSGWVPAGCLGRSDQHVGTSTRRRGARA